MVINTSTCLEDKRGIYTSALEEECWGFLETWRGLNCGNSYRCPSKEHGRYASSSYGTIITFYSDYNKA
jgi:hypothetical protein